MRVIREALRDPVYKYSLAIIKVFGVLTVVSILSLLDK